ncbi:tRNA (cmo5U34)-methyltransferase [Haloferula luteola]|uniref:Carboxy-S-adenosyl-L-methionine synthase n=1 Tax=Haloferula luteola TaxID=595692 RepID=A0A840UYE9_9BACT|nr:carboxy-S-adenosyl-L-methionine synthase CmoA [Haloferula luteola]MBB5350765.1 tRNA (cmo5U34)-methyltransferase [Haloferula luteola]
MKRIRGVLMKSDAPNFPQTLAEGPIDPPIDRVFEAPDASVADFKFGKKVASVFDDMVSRSVPFYGEVQRMVAEMVADYAVTGTHVYDLGCSTGTTFLGIDGEVAPGVKFIGIDNSHEMLDRCRSKLAEKPMAHEVELQFGDLNAGVKIENASVVLLVLTLQFVRPLYRDQLIADILGGMHENGALILVEKVIGEDSLFNRQFIKYYYEMKRRHGYSELEISQKREALENVLIPYKLLENREMLLRAGFRYCDTFFKWYNFTGMIAVK